MSTYTHAPEAPGPPQSSRGGRYLEDPSADETSNLPAKNNAQFSSGSNADNAFFSPGSRNINTSPGTRNVLSPERSENQRQTRSPDARPGAYDEVMSPGKSSRYSLTPGDKNTSPNRGNGMLSPNRAKGVNSPGRAKGATSPGRTAGTLSPGKQAGGQISSVPSAVEKSVYV
jgi:hypothetical protein